MMNYDRLIFIDNFIQLLKVLKQILHKTSNSYKGAVFTKFYCVSSPVFCQVDDFLKKRQYYTL